MASPDAHARADRIVAAVQAKVGTGFRPQGRGAAGLDCLGLALVAADAAGSAPAVPAFPMRGTSLDAGEALLLGFGCRRLTVDAVEPGDLLLQMPAALQLHLAVVTPAGLVEAHAGLRRVVERPRVTGEIWQSGWRLPAGED